MSSAEGPMPCRVEAIGVRQRRASTAGAAVDVQRTRCARIARGGDAFGAVAGRSVREEQPSGGRDQAVEGRVVERAHGRERRHALDPQDLVLVDVADAGERALVHQGDADLHAGPGRVAQPSTRLGAIERRIEEVRAETRERRVEGGGSRLEQLDDRRIEADRDGARHLEHQAGPGRGPAPRLARPVAVPRPVHAQVRAELQPAVEPDDQVLADRLHGVDATSDKAVGLRDRARAVGARRGDGAPDEVRPKPGGGPVERVALGHAATSRCATSGRGRRARTRPR